MEEKDKRELSPVSRWLDQFERHPLTRLFAGSFLVLGMLGLLLDLSDKQVERDNRQEERIARAWQLLTTPASGNSGKVWALEYLYRNAVSLRGIDLSCETMGGGWHENTLTCDRPVDLRGLNLDSPAASDLLEDGRYAISKTGPRGTRISGTMGWLNGCLAKQQQPVLQDAAARGPNARFEIVEPFAALRDYVRKAGVDLRNAKLSGVDFSGSHLTGANLDGADLRGSLFHEVNAQAASLRGILASNAKVSKSDFSGSEWDIFVLDILPDRADLLDFSHALAIESSTLDGSSFKAWNSTEFQISRSSVKNSYLQVMMWHPGLVDGMINMDALGGGFHQTNLTCSFIINDANIRLGGSNISDTLFPLRFFKTTQDVKGTDIDVEYFIERNGWDTSWSKSPWAWSDRPPIGELNGERVISCPRQSNIQNPTTSRSDMLAFDCPTIEYDRSTNVTEYLFSFPEHPNAVKFTYFSEGFTQGWRGEFNVENAP